MRRTPALGWIMSLVFWDSNLFIYLFEVRGRFAERVADLRARMLERGDQLFTSALTLGEVLVKPIEARDEALTARWHAAIAETAVVVPFSLEAAPIYARIRSDRTVRAPDAIQLACAASSAIDLFITN